jgi:hypothetical protein
VENSPLVLSRALSCEPTFMSMESAAYACATFGIVFCIYSSLIYFVVIIVHLNAITFKLNVN